MVDPDVVRHVARLARLGLQPGEEEALVADLVSILQHFEVLQQVDTTGVEPLTHPLGAAGTVRPDEVVAFPHPREALGALTEHTREGFYIVPRILETEDAG